jgi:signal transduction histidine kinase/HAMP domain-containing protein
MGIRGTLLVAFAIIWGFVLFASGVAIQALSEVTEIVSGVTQQRASTIVESSRLAQQAARAITVAITAARPISVVTDEALFRQQIDEIKQAEDGLIAARQALRSGEASEQNTLLAPVDEVLDNIHSLINTTGQRLKMRAAVAVAVAAATRADLSFQRAAEPAQRAFGSDVAGMATNDQGSEHRHELTALYGFDRVQLAFATVYRTLLSASQSPSVVELDLQAVVLRREVTDLRQAVASLSGDGTAEIGQTALHLAELAETTDGVVPQRRQELQLLAQSAALLDRNAVISKDLLDKIDLFIAEENNALVAGTHHAAEVARSSTVRMIAVTVISLVCSALIVWLYVFRNLAVRLDRIKSAMLQLATGDLTVTLPKESTDEVGRMAGTLQVFRATTASAYQQQAATAEVLKAIKGSSNLQAVLDTLVATVARLCEAEMTGILRPRGEIFEYAASYGYSPEFVRFMETHPIRIGRGTIVGRTLLQGTPVHVPDIEADPEYTFQEAQRAGHFRTIAGVPMLLEAKPIGVIVLMRTRMQPFTEHSLNLAATFADQAVIAIQNVRLLSELHARSEEAEAALVQLTQTQESLLRAEKLASLGQLVAGIAHEINTPVGNALAASSQTRDETARLETLIATGKLRRSELEDYLGTVKELSDILMRNCQRAGQLIRDFKQVAADQTSGQRRRFDLADQLRETLRTLHHRFDRAKVSLVTDLPAKIPMDSLPGALSQIIINLAENALAHAFAPGTDGSLTVSAKPIARDRVEITVADDGKGITQEVLPKIFDPFFTTNRGAGNTGLGLHIVHNLVTGPLGGTIQVTSAVGEGAQFVLRLPLASPAPATPVSHDEISPLLDPLAR